MKKKKLLKIILTFAFWIAVWQITAVLVSYEILLPSPVSTVRSLLSLMKTSGFYISVLSSVLRIFCGFFCGTLLGIAFGTVSYKSPVAGTLLSPLSKIIKATPVASIIVLLFVWFSNSTVTSVTSLLIVLPVVWSSTLTALNSVDGKLLEMAEVFRVPVYKRIRDIYFPSVLPSLKAAFSSSMGLAWKSGVAAEVICTPKHSIGGGIYNAKVYLETPELFAWTLTVILISFISEKLLLFILSSKKGT